jgi:hypothetical protein
MERKKEYAALFPSFHYKEFESGKHEGMEEESWRLKC